MKYRRIYSHQIKKAIGLKCDQTIQLTGLQTREHYPERLRRVRYFDSETNKVLTFITNHFLVDTIIIAQLYKCRWQIELFFKWIKQHLRIKSFYGTSENAVKTQIWIAVCVYVLISIVKKYLRLNLSLYTFLDILSTSPFEEVDILQLVTKGEKYKLKSILCNQLNLFD